MILAEWSTHLTTLIENIRHRSQNEKFSRPRLRKLYRSIARNHTGDLAIRIAANHRAVIYASGAEKTDMGIDHPGET